MASRRVCRCITFLLATLVAEAALSAELYRYQNEEGITVVDWAIPSDFVSA